MKRREFISFVGGVAATWPLAAHAQQPALPVVAFVRDGSLEANARYVAAFRKGLNESGYVEGQNITIEYHWLEGQYDRLPALLADLVRRPVAVIATLGNCPLLAQSGHLKLHGTCLLSGVKRTCSAPSARTIARINSRI